jgi:hypothetical protein
VLATRQALQKILISTLIYIVPPILMVVLTLLLTPRVNRTVNIVVSFLYMISIMVSCIGETWVYYLLGSLVSVRSRGTRDAGRRA